MMFKRIYLRLSERGLELVGSGSRDRVRTFIAVFLVLPGCFLTLVV